MVKIFKVMSFALLTSCLVFSKQVYAEGSEILETEPQVGIQVVEMLPTEEELFEQQEDLTAKKQKLKEQQKLIKKQQKLIKKQQKLIKKQQKQLKKEKLEKNELEVPSKSELKTACASYMSYTAITSKSSPQYKLQHWSKTKTNKAGVRMVTDSDGVKRICVAMGTYYGPVGTKLKIVLENGQSFHAIIGDSKSDRGTDEKHQYHKYIDGTKKSGDHSVVEFIVGDSKAFLQCHKEDDHYVSNSFVKKIYYEGKEKKFL